MMMENHHRFPVTNAKFFSIAFQMLLPDWFKPVGTNCQPVTSRNLCETIPKYTLNPIENSVHKGDYFISFFLANHFILNNNAPSRCNKAQSPAGLVSEARPV